MQPTKAKGAAATSSSRADDDGASSGAGGGAIDELPLHLTEKILQSFSPLASARLATVCKSWATAVSDRLARPVPHLFVYLPADITKSDRRGIVVSVSLDADYPPAATVIPNRVLLKDTNGLRCIGAMPSGCLAFENPWRCDTRVLLVNPITGALQRVDVDKLRRNPVIAAGGGTDTDSFVCHGPGGLELWRRAGGGGEWSKLPVAAAALRTDGTVSVANCNGRFYILDRDGEVSVIDAGVPPPLRVEKLPVASLFGQFARLPCPAADAPAAQGSLLESDGEVLFVRRVLGSKKAAGGAVAAFCNHDADAEADELLAVVGFEVYRLDVEERRWKEVRKLRTNRSLFVSPRSAFAVRSSETEGCRSNCIYFVDKKRYCAMCNLDDGNTWGVYPMEHREVLFKHAVTGKGPCSEATWFLPRVG